MKQRSLSVCIITLLITSCNLVASGTPTVVPPITPSIVSTATLDLDGSVVSINNVSFTIPEELANDALTEMAAATTDGAPWELGPEHVKIVLTGYELEDTFHQPQIYVYPADEYAQVNPGAAEQIERLKSILAGSTPLKETLPQIPFFNAEMQLAANIQRISFQGGTGVRHLTQYAQYLAPINNNELIYQFAGLTSDERYFILAILPIHAPFLAENEKQDAPVPTDGVPIPTDVGPNDAYYASITEKLVALDSESYTPSLNTLDALIQSIRITNP